MAFERYRFGLELVTAPDVEAVTVEQARANCSIEGSYHDDFLRDLIRQAREHIEQRAGVCLIGTQWKLTCDRFPKGSAALHLPRWPVLSVDDVAYLAADGSAAVVAESALAVRRDRNGQGSVRLSKYACWPVCELTPDAVAVTFTAGFGLDAESVPAPWRRAVLMLVAWWFEQRETAALSGAGSVPYGIEQLIEAAACLEDFKPFDLG